MKSITREEVCQAVTQAVMLCLDYIAQQGNSQEVHSPTVQLYTYTDLAEMLGKSKDTIRQWVCAGDFGEPIQVGNSTRVTQEGLDKFLSDHSGPTKKMPNRARKHITRATAKPQGQPLGI